MACINLHNVTNDLILIQLSNEKGETTNLNNISLNTPFDPTYLIWVWMFFSGELWSMNQSYKNNTLTTATINNHIANFLNNSATRAGNLRYLVVFR